MSIGIEDIDDQFVDVDFEKDPKYVFGDLGVGLCGSSWGIYEDKFGVMSDAEIEEAIERNASEGLNGARLVKRIFNQGREGSCVANACAQAHQIVQALQYGLNNVIDISAMSLYKRIGRSAGSGAMVSDGLEEGQERGFLPLDTAENKARFEHTHPATGFSKKLPEGWEETASGIAFVECDIIRTVAGLETALAKHQPVVVGRQGHSIVYADIAKRSGRRVYPYPNSWGNWGSAYADMETGFGFDSVSQMKQSARWAFTVRAVRSPQKVTA